MSADLRVLPYGHQSIGEDDVAAVVDALQSGWLTTGPRVAEFEKAVASTVNVRHAVAVTSGTAALHASMFAIDLKPGDEVIVPPMTFAATANCIVFQGGTPVFADVLPDSLLIDPKCVENNVTSRTRAVIAVDYTGHPCDYDELRDVAARHGLKLVADACHAPGASYKGRPVGSLADLSTLSFHPVKHITTGEGGMIMTNDDAYAERMCRFRNHGITRDPAHLVAASGSYDEPWYYEMQELGYNYRLSDINCALGLSQLRKLDAFVERRREIAKLYSSAFASLPYVATPCIQASVQPAWHLYVLQIDFESLGKSRSQVAGELRSRGIGSQVHYIPVHLHPFYRERFGTAAGLCPVAEAAYRRILSIPMFPAMSDEDVQRVIAALERVINRGAS